MAARQPPNVGDRIREAREATGRSQVAFAAWLGFSERAVQAWERSERTPRLPALTVIAKKTGRPVAWFYTEHDDPKVAA